MKARARKVMRWMVHQLVRLLSQFVPKDPSLWVMGGNRGVRYADNSMHFHRHCVAIPGIQAVWLTRSPKILQEVRGLGARAYTIASLPGLWYGLRASWHVFDVGPGDTGPTSDCARRMNLWHGIPLKDISFLKAGGSKATLDPADHFAHPNHRHIADILCSFNLLKSNIVIADLPRNRVFSAGYDPVADARAGDRRWVHRLQEARDQGVRVIGYFPTWRGSGKDLFLGATSSEEIRDLDHFLASRRLLLATKWHTCSFKEYRHPGVSKTAEEIDAEISGNPSLISLPFDLDLNSILPVCDLLLTDYSSVLFDYALSDRPQIFVPYDLAEYEMSVGFFHDYTNLVPGPIVRSIRDLMVELDAFHEAPEGYRQKGAAKRARLRSSFFEATESSSLIEEYMVSVSGRSGPMRG